MKAFVVNWFITEFIQSCTINFKPGSFEARPYRKLTRSHESHVELTLELPFMGRRHFRQGCLSIHGAPPATTQAAPNPQRSGFTMTPSPLANFALQIHPYLADQPLKLAGFPHVALDYLFHGATYATACVRSSPHARHYIGDYPTGIIRPTPAVHFTYGD